MFDYSGESDVAKLFVEYARKNNFELSFHWCQHYKENDKLLYNKFMYIYQEEDNIIEFQYSRVNTLSGTSRAHKGRKLLGSKKENDKYIECTLGKDLF